MTTSVTAIGTMPIHERAATGFALATEAYERGRPGYPIEAIRYLIQSLHLTPFSCVLDLGAGTGKFTRALHACGLSAVAVEPVDRMREKLVELHPDIKTLYGTAEEIPVDDESLDVVTVAQAFHWFDGGKALREINRKLRVGGHLVLIWNVRDENESWVKDLTKLIDPYEGGAPRYKSMEWLRAFASSSQFVPEAKIEFPHAQIGTAAMMVDRVASISFIAALPATERDLVLQRVRDLIATNVATRGQTEITMPYQTRVYVYRKA